MRELFWHTTTLTNALTHAYDQLGAVGHDHDDDPQASVTAIAGGLHAVAAHLAGIDHALDDVHGHAAHLYRHC